MKTKEAISKEVRKKGVITSALIVNKLGISRQAAAKHLREMVKEGKLAKIGSTRLARYVAYNPRQAVEAKRDIKFSSAYNLNGLDETSVFREIELKIGLPRKLSAQAYRIAGYAFTEMLNNAIDHSHGSKAIVTFECGPENLCFEIRDYGIGVFESLRRKFRLRDHFVAAEHLLKGKQSADPKRHSGQGIFFTSKIADEFILESAKQKIVIDNRIQDVFLKDISKVKGTRVVFVLKRRTRKDLKQLFAAYTDSDYEFDKTKLMVHLSGQGAENISRSQAKRLLFGLERFKRVVLDFKKVNGIGQGFADEIFRVFQNSHPNIRIESVNTSKSVEFMIRRAQRWGR